MTLSLKETFIKMNSTRNLAVWDRVLRGALPFVIGALWWAEIIPTAVALPTGIISLMLLPTAFTGACSIYYLLGFSTCPISGQAKPPTG